MWWLVLPALARPPVRIDGVIRLDTVAEPGPFGWSDEPRNVRYWFSARVRGDEEGTRAEDGKLTTTCSVVDHGIAVDVSYRPSNYPEHLPEETSCRVGRYDIHVAVVPQRPLYTDPAELRADLAMPLPLRLHAREGEGGYAVRNVSFALPTDVPWRAADTFAKDATGATWGEGTCTVRLGERPVLVVHYDSDMLAGAGSCTVVDGAGVARVVSLLREDLPRDP